MQGNGVDERVKSGRGDVGPNVVAKACSCPGPPSPALNSTSAGERFCFVLGAEVSEKWTS